MRLRLDLLIGCHVTGALGSAPSPCGAHMAPRSLPLASSQPFDIGAVEFPPFMSENH
jgi:hypothetical protein